VSTGLELPRRPDVGFSRELLSERVDVNAFPMSVNQVASRGSAYLFCTGHHFVAESPGVLLLLLLLLLLLMPMLRRLLLHGFGNLLLLLPYSQGPHRRHATRATGQ